MRFSLLMTAGGRRRQLSLRDSHPDQYVARVKADILLFPRIVADQTSTLISLTAAEAMSKLLADSGSQLFDRRTMAGHLQALKRLIAQTRCFELLSGQDLYQEPGNLATLLADVGV